MTDGGPVDALCGWFDVWFRGSDEAAVDNEIRLSTGPDPTGEGGSRGGGGLEGRARAAGNNTEGHWGHCLPAPKQRRRVCGHPRTELPACASHLLLASQQPLAHVPRVPLLSTPTHVLARFLDFWSTSLRTVSPRRHALGAADVPAAPAHRLRARRQAARGDGGEPAAGQPAAAGRQGLHQRGGRQHIRGAVQEPAHVPVEHRVRVEGETSWRRWMAWGGVAVRLRGGGCGRGKGGG